MTRDTINKIILKFFESQWSTDIEEVQLHKMMQFLNC